VNARGFTLVELLVATFVMLLVAGALTTLAVPIQRSFDRSLAGVEVTTRARTAINSMASEIRDAGAGVLLANMPQRLSAVFPVAVPARSLTDSRIVAPLTAITLYRAGGGQAFVAEFTPVGSVLVPLDDVRPSVGQNGTGGFRAGDLAVVFDAIHAQLVTVVQVTAADGTLNVAPPLMTDYARGALIAGVERTTFGLRAGGGGTSRLVRVTSGGAEQPLVDDVSQLDITCWATPNPATPGDAATIGPIPADQMSDGPWYPDAGGFDIDLLRIRRVDLDLQLETTPPALRPLVPGVAARASISLRGR
jgi:prepilin-type N-terminal cleavage/methylation domain-containing protein